MLPLYKIKMKFSRHRRRNRRSSQPESSNKGYAITDSEDNFWYGVWTYNTSTHRWERTFLRTDWAFCWSPQGQICAKLKGIPNRFVPGSANWERIWCDEGEGWGWSDHTDLIKWSRAIRLRLWSSAHCLSEHYINSGFIEQSGGNQQDGALLVSRTQSQR